MLGAFFESWHAMRRFRALPLEARSIVFYAETKADWVHFEPIIRELTGPHGRTVCYLTSDPQDPITSETNPGILAFCIGSASACTILFRTLEAKVLVMTLTDLDTYHLKRSLAYPVHYLYVFHSMVSSHMVFRKEAYDAYDTILCVGPHHVREIRRNEALHGLKPKRLVECGYGRLDTILETAARRPRFVPSAGPSKKVLIAPSWGRDSISETCAAELIDVLLQAGHQTVFRPHPMTVKQHPALIDGIRQRFASHARFALEVDVRSAESLHSSDIMISDWSGAALEFAFGLERPVLFIDTPRKVNNQGYEKLGCEPLEVVIRNEVGEVVSPRRLGDVGAAIARLCAEPAALAETIRRSRSRWMFNVGSSGTVGADAVLTVLNGLEHVESQQRAVPGA